MTDTALSFDNDALLGKVGQVDTHRITIAVDDPSMTTSVRVGELIAIKGASEREYLIAIVVRVLRSLGTMILHPTSADEPVPTATPTDQVLATLVGTYRTVEGDRRNVFKRGADSFPQIDRHAFVIQSENLQKLMGLLAGDFDAEERLTLGHFVADSSAEAVASGDRLFQRHAAILGSTGSGKSFAVALLLERAAKLKFPNIIVLDMHGEYAALADGSDAIAVNFKIAGPGDLDSPSDTDLFLPYWMMNNEEMLSMILDRSDQNAPNQASRFRTHIRELKEKTLAEAGQEEVRKTFTIDSPVPFAIEELLAELVKDNERKGVGKTGNPVTGPWEGKLTRFIARLTAKLEDRRYGFMFSPPDVSNDYGWLVSQAWRLLQSGNNSGIKIVDFSEVPSDILPVVAGMFARFLYDVQFWMAPDERTPVTILCDEAHLYLPVRQDASAVERQALAAFERIAKEGRKYGVSIVVVSQRPADISRTILSQCNNFIALRLTNETDQGVIRRMVPDQMADLTETLPLLDVGEALVLGDAVLLPTRIKLDKPAKQPTSQTRDFWREWATKEPKEVAVEKAVQSLRGQSRISENRSVK